jgi:Subtilase family
MKKILTGIILLWMWVHTCAQSPAEQEQIMQNTNRAVLTILSDSFSKMFQKNREEALRMAPLQRWPLRIAKTGGGMKELMGVSNDRQPVYAETLNAGAGITSRANKLYSGGGMGLAVQGEGMVAGLWDVSGIRLSHEVFENRVTQMDPIYTAVTANHSTHVAGTIVASDVPQNGLVRGMAFKARLHAYDWYNDLSEAAIAAGNGLLISCHPYSLAPQPITYWGTYIERAAAWDQIMYNAPYYLVVWAGGNGGPYTDRLTNEAANKNGLAIASVYQLDEYTGPASVVISNFSSKGPARDGRIKPELCARGEAVLSANFNANNTSYNYGWGTSMASASATGTLLLLQQHYKNVKGSSFMKAATLKALAIHTADEAGAYPGPDIIYGWGLLNAQRAAELISTGDLSFRITERDLYNGEMYVKNIIACGNGPLTATLCWTDPPGAVVNNHNDATPRLINDLDIRITCDGQTYLPWKLDPANSSAPAIRGDNDRDNLEKIEIPDAVAGQTYTITISYKGILNTTVGMGKQDFSLIISGEADCQRDGLVQWRGESPLYFPLGAGKLWHGNAGSICSNCILALNSLLLSLSSMFSPLLSICLCDSLRNGL